jgi:crossover junction endodeoxyribonuclease RuvC
MIILGIDPGTATTGYGFIKTLSFKKKKVKTIKCIAYGLIETSPSSAMPERLKKLNNELNSLIEKYQPEILAVEKVYFFKNLKTVIPVSQAKGVILLTAAKKKIPVYEFTPMEIKKNLVNYGWAEKKIIQKKIKSLLRLKNTPIIDDAADALATAICCARLLKI